MKKSKSLNTHFFLFYMSSQYSHAVPVML